MLFKVAVGAVIVIVIAVIVYNYLRSKAINERGIEADAVVTRVKEIESENDEGIHDVTYEYYVTYTNEAGQAVEAKLGNPPRFIMEGTTLRVKYLPEKPKYVLRVE